MEYIGRTRDRKILRDAAAFLDLATIAYIEGMLNAADFLRARAFELTRTFRQPSELMPLEVTRVLAFMSQGHYLETCPLNSYPTDRSVAIHTALCGPRIAVTATAARSWT